MSFISWPCDALGLELAHPGGDRILGRTTMAAPPSRTEFWAACSIAGQEGIRFLCHNPGAGNSAPWVYGIENGGEPSGPPGYAPASRPAESGTTRRARTGEVAGDRRAHPPAGARARTGRSWRS